jgi:hypothetical protein
MERAGQMPDDDDTDDTTRMPDVSDLGDPRERERMPVLY